MLKPTWLIDSGAVYNGTDTINGTLADQWTCMGSVNGVNNYAATTDDRRRPVAFWEVKNDLPKRWDFHLETFVDGAPDPDLFAVPNDCDRYC